MSHRAGGEPTLSIVSLGGSLGVDRAAAFDMPLSDFAPGGTLLSLRAARGLFTDDTSRRCAVIPHLPAHMRKCIPT